MRSSTVSASKLNVIESLALGPFDLKDQDHLQVILLWKMEAFFNNLELTKTNSLFSFL